MPIELGRVRALLFDVDGTLSDTDDEYAARIVAALRFVPLLSDRERLARRLVMSLESPGNVAMGLADKLGVDDELIGLLEWLHRLRGRRARRPPQPVPGVESLLMSLDGRFPMAVVSSRDERSTLEFLDRSGLRPHFSAIITALSAQHAKPFPDPVLLAARELGVTAADCLMIGDTTIDVRAGRLAGAQTVGVLCGFGERSELLRQGADLILPSTPDLLPYLLPGEARVRV